MLGIAVVLGASAAHAWPKPTSAPAPAGRTITRKVRMSLASYDRDAALAGLKAHTQGVRVVVVKGLFGDFIPGYGKPNLKALRDAGFRAELSDTKTAGAMAPDVAKLEQLIRDSDVPIVFVSHSQGSAKVSEAIANLKAQDPSLLRKVRGHIAMAPAYGGSPIADVLAEYKAGRAVATGITKLAGGQPAAIYDLRTSVRHAVTAARPMPVDVVPTISLVAYQPRWLTPRFFTLALLKWGFGLRSDGLMPHRDQVIPGSDVARLPMDHLSPVTGATGEKLTLTLMTHLFSTPQPRP